MVRAIRGLGDGREADHRRPAVNATLTRGAVRANPPGHKRSSVKAAGIPTWRTSGHAAAHAAGSEGVKTAGQDRPGLHRRHAGLPPARVEPAEPLAGNGQDTA